MLAAFEALVWTAMVLKPFAMSMQSCGEISKMTILSLVAASVWKLAAFACLVNRSSVASSRSVQICVAAIAFEPVPEVSWACSGVSVTCAALPWLTWQMIHALSALPSLTYRLVRPAASAAGVSSDTGGRIMGSENWRAIWLLLADRASAMGWAR